MSIPPPPVRSGTYSKPHDSVVLDDFDPKVIGNPKPHPAPGLDRTRPGARLVPAKPSRCDFIQIYDELVRWCQTHPIMKLHRERRHPVVRAMQQFEQFAEPPHQVAEAALLWFTSALRS
jgi:hypothetical protein